MEPKTIDEKLETFNKHFQAALRKWEKDPTPGLATYLLREYEIEVVS